ncbi:hypothetical protein L1887_23764 [Cichorium endivia]|nr:hypothetical protein L1887_23764 [Cichorium endivia]
MYWQKPPHDYSRQLYDKSLETFEEYITLTVLPSLREKHGEFMLRELVKRWSNHKVMVRWFSGFIDNVCRYFINERSLPTVKEFGLSGFHDQVHQYVNGKVGEAVISMIDREREGEQIDRGLVKAALDISVEIGMGKMDYYEDDFEPSMLEHTTTYYSHKASQWISEDSIHDYMLKVEDCLKREKDMASHYLHSSCVPKLLEIVQHELLSIDATKLLEKDDTYFIELLRNDKVEDLSRLYRLCSKMPAVLNHASSMFKQHVIAEGKKLVNQAEDAASTKKEQALDEACEIICNKGIAGSSSAELLATFCDNTLKRGGSEKLSDDAIEDTLEKVVKLLAYNNDKDRFAEFYRKKLARRLLFDKSAHDEHERSILTKLKQLCGGQFTSKMEEMLTDLTSAKEDQSYFGYVENSMVMHICQVKCVEVFEDFYKPKTKQKKLTWIYSLGTCNIIGNFEPKTMALNVTTNQASVLLLFNSSDRLSYQEIMTKLNSSHDDVVRLLHSLSCAKYKIILKEPNTKTISPTDYFEFNSKFTDKMRKIKIPLTPEDENKKVLEDVDQDRRFTIDASIVRIMKFRKMLGYKQLVVECVQQMKRIFKPDEEAIKKRIEDLITRDFLERDNEDPNRLWYLA